MDSEQMLGLLREAHTFPGPYDVRTFVRPGSRAAVIAAIGGALVEGHVAHVDERPSRSGAWVRLRITLQVPCPEEILPVYAALHELDEVRYTL